MGKRIALWETVHEVGRLSQPSRHGVALSPKRFTTD
jgi:hypothetical protein